MRLITEASGIINAEIGYGYSATSYSATSYDYSYSATNGSPSIGMGCNRGRRNGKHPLSGSWKHYQEF
jgi:hypothetical protein